MNNYNEKYNKKKINVFIVIIIHMVAIITLYDIWFYYHYYYYYYSPWRRLGGWAADGAWPHRWQDGGELERAADDDDDDAYVDDNDCNSGNADNDDFFCDFVVFGSWAKHFQDHPS